jgi:hypothetical protein
MGRCGFWYPNRMRYDARLSLLLLVLFCAAGRSESPGHALIRSAFTRENREVNVPPGFPCSKELPELLKHTKFEVISEVHHFRESVILKRADIIKEAADGKYALFLENHPTSLIAKPGPPESNLYPAFNLYKNAAPGVLMRGLEDEIPGNLGVMVTYYDTWIDTNRQMAEARRKGFEPVISKTESDSYYTQILGSLRKILISEVNGVLFDALVASHPKFESEQTAALVEQLQSLRKRPREQAVKLLSDFFQRAVNFRTADDLLQKGGFFETASELNYRLILQAKQDIKNKKWGDRHELTPERVQLLDLVPPHFKDPIAGKDLTQLERGFTSVREENMVENAANFFCDAAKHSNPVFPKASFLIGSGHRIEFIRRLKDLAKPQSIEVTETTLE